MDPYSLEIIARCKIGEDCKAAARYGLAVRASQANRDARHNSGSPLAALFRMLASLLDRRRRAAKGMVSVGDAQ